MMNTKITIAQSVQKIMIVKNLKARYQNEMYLRSKYNINFKSDMMLMDEHIRPLTVFRCEISLLAVT